MKLVYLDTIDRINRERIQREIEIAKKLIVKEK